MESHSTSRRFITFGLVFVSFMLFCIILLLGATLLSVTNMTQDSATETTKVVQMSGNREVDSIIDATVHLTNTECTRNDGTEVVGTGFAIDEHEITTARHVVGGSVQPEITDQDGHVLTVTGVRMSHDPAVDLAWITVAETLPVVLAPHTDNLVAGATVWTAGYPDDVFSMVSGVYAQRALVEDPMSDTTSPLPLFDIDTKKGASGSAIVDQEGRYVGVLTLFVNMKDNKRELVAAEPAQNVLETPREPALSCTAYDKLTGDARSEPTD